MMAVNDHGRSTQFLQNAIGERRSARPASRKRQYKQRGRIVTASLRYVPSNAVAGLRLDIRNWIVDWAACTTREQLVDSDLIATVIMLDRRSELVRRRS